MQSHAYIVVCHVVNQIFAFFLSDGSQGAAQQIQTTAREVADYTIQYCCMPIFSFKAKSYTRVSTNK
jgi:hypothetical protein